MHLRFNNIIYVSIFVYVIISYIKNTILYHPVKANSDKYIKFYRKILQLTNSPSTIANHIVKTPDGIQLDTICIKNTNTDMYIILFHGNSGNISMRYDIVKFLYNYCSVIIFDYRSYGKSTGSNPNCKNLQIDSRAIWDFVVDKLQINPHNISLMGESLGCSLAISLAADLSKTLDSKLYPHSLILNTPFYSLASMIEINMSNINLYYASKIFSTIFGSEYESNKWIQYVNHQTSIIIAHSVRDEIIPYTEGTKLYNLINKIHPKTKFINITGTHNNLGLTEEYVYALSDIISN